VTHVLHPDSPVFTSESLWIQLFFSLLVLLSIALGARIAVWLYRKII